MPRESVVELLVYFKHYDDDTACARAAGYRVEQWSHRRILAAAHQVARELESLGITKGDRILLWGENCAEWIAAFWGCALIGAVIVPLDRNATPDFAERVVREVQPKVAIGSHDLIRGLPAVPMLEFGAKAFQETGFGKVVGHVAFPRLARHDPLQIVFTSGATAQPKGVVITHGNVLANLEPIEREIAKYRKYERLFHPLRFLNMLPLSHVFGQFMGLFVPPMLGATVIFQDSLSPSDIVHTIKSQRVSALVAVPRLLETLRAKVESDFEGQPELEDLRAETDTLAGKHFLRRWWHFRRVRRGFGLKFWAFISGGATLTPETEEFWQRLGYAVVQGYGLTETTSLISLAHPFHLSRGTIGKVLPGREMKLDPDTGEILIRGESVASSYWQSREMKAAVGEDGWLRTGDVGAMDDGGNLHFKGRMKDVIVTPEGFNIYPGDLESALRRQPEVRDCLVIGLERAGNAVPCAVLILHPGSDAAAVMKRANQLLTDHQQMRQSFIWPEPDFPRTSTQKPRTGVIAARIGKESGLHAATGTENTPGSLPDLIARITRRAPGKIRPDATLQADMNLSSLERVELMTAIEDRYQISLDEEKFSTATTVADLQRMLEGTTATKADTAKYHPAISRKLFHYPGWAQRQPVQALRAALYYLLTWPATILLALPRVEGREHLRAVRGPLLLISNHVTYLDAGLILYALPPRLRHRVAVAMAGEVLNEIRHPRPEQNLFLRLISKTQYILMTAMFNVFPLPQHAGFRNSFAFAGESVDRGYSVLVFPEGARTTDGKMASFRGGIGLLAQNLRLPVTPLRIDGLWERKKSGRRGFAPWRAITLRIGAPITIPPGADPAQITRQLEQAVRTL